MGFLFMNIEELSAFAKSRGFFWPSAEIYGGSAGIFDYGHVGALLKRRFEDLWLSYFVNTNKNYHLIDGANLIPEAPLIASGHVTRFNDILVGCSKCKTYYKADVLFADNKIKISDGAGVEEVEQKIKEHKIVCPKDKGALMKPKAFNLMIDAALGPEKSFKTYLRPETAQSTYLSFFREFNILRKELPLGLAIIGRAYRNEIAPRQGLYRQREFSQAELQIFFDPESWKPEVGGNRKMNVLLYKNKQLERLSASELVKEHKIPEFYAKHMELIHAFYTDVLKIPEDKFRFLEKGEDERAFYNKIHMDIEVNIESWGGFNEVGGLHYRGDYDLGSHAKGSGQQLSVKVGEKEVLPNVLELSFGVDRNVWMLIDVLYKKEGEWSVLALPEYLAPYQIAVFPLQKDEAIEKKVQEVVGSLKDAFKVVSDSSGSIGKRYARMDEIGTPFCVTVDYNTVDKSSKEFNTVTIRSRDDRKQARVEVEKLKEFFGKHYRLMNAFEVEK